MHARGLTGPRARCDVFRRNPARLSDYSARLSLRVHADPRENDIGGGSKLTLLFRSHCIGPRLHSALRAPVPPPRKDCLDPGPPLPRNFILFNLHYTAPITEVQGYFRGVAYQTKSRRGEHWLLPIIGGVDLWLSVSRFRGFSPEVSTY